MIVKRSSFEMPLSKTREKRYKEKKKIKPVYFDDILMETLNITRKVLNKKEIFQLRRNHLVFFLNDQLTTRENNLPFVPFDQIFVKLDLNSEWDKEIEENLIKTKKKDKSE